MKYIKICLRIMGISKNLNVVFRDILEKTANSL